LSWIFTFGPSGPSIPTKPGGPANPGSPIITSKHLIYLWIKNSLIEEKSENNNVGRLVCFLYYYGNEKIKSL